jgi:hypothetical protein
MKGRINMQTQTSDESTWKNEPIDNPTWELRTNETINLFEDIPELPLGRWIGVRVVPLRLPPGPVAPYKGIVLPVEEHAAVVACEHDEEGRWKWVQLGPPTKAYLIDWLIDECHVKRDRWYYVGLTPTLHDTADGESGRCTECPQ